MPYSFLFEDYIMTISLPYTKRFEINLNKIWEEFKKEINFSSSINTIFDNNELQYERKVALNS